MYQSFVAVMAYLDWAEIGLGNGVGPFSPLFVLLPPFFKVNGGEKGPRRFMMVACQNGWRSVAFAKSMSLIFFHPKRVVAWLKGRVWGFCPQPPFGREGGGSLTRLEVLSPEGGRIWNSVRSPVQFLQPVSKGCVLRLKFANVRGSVFTDESARRQCSLGQDAFPTCHHMQECSPNNY